MSTAANAQGVVNVNLTIPANIPAGSKEIVVNGAGGSRGTATYVGRGQIVQQELQQVTTQRIASTRPVDPLAQTFTLPTTRMVGGVDLWITNKGSNVTKNPVVVQVRGVTLGIPNDEIYAQSVVAWDNLQLAPTATRVTWPPFVCLAGQTYAIVVMSKDPVQALQVAEVGKFDATAQAWISAQPYQIGVLLSSSNAQTWTPHQTLDMKFRLLAAKFTSNTREVLLHTQAVTGVTDLVVLSGVTRPDVSADFYYKLVMGSSTVVVPEGQLLRLSAPYTGNIEVRAVFTTQDDRYSAILNGGVQLLAGTVSTSDLYYSRAIPASATANIDVRLDVLLTGAATVAVAYQKDGAGGWTGMTAMADSPASGGFTEKHWRNAGVTGIAGNIRIRVTITGNTANRPRLRGLRAFAT